ncbi:hypothetical protein RRF57_005233 [Xylaria bambusicola]|uniref:Uncharacterized protein n=1 Tax=Xylaria bambusicola TaxID=326684 RepID=A0AAN7UPT2_9PEZI
MSQNLLTVVVNPVRRSVPLPIVTSGIAIQTFEQLEMSSVTRVVLFEGTDEAVRLDDTGRYSRGFAGLGTGRDADWSGAIGVAFGGNQYYSA